MQMDLQSQVESLRKSFLFAGRGIASCIMTERNMRIHLTTTVLVIFCAAVYKATYIEWALLCLAFGLVMSAELMNTAIEAVVNFSSTGYSTGARVAKDVAAGGVMMTALASIAVGCIVFLHKDRLLAALNTLVDYPMLIILLAVLIALGIGFIFFFPRFVKKIKK